MQQTPPENAQDHTVFTPIPSMSGSQQPPQEEKTPPSGKQSLFYTQEDDLDLHLPQVDEQDDQADQSSPFVLPFQPSGAMPTMATIQTHQQGATSTPPPATTSPGKKRWGSFQLLKVVLIGGVVLITIIGASLFVFAQSTPPPEAIHVTSTHTPTTRGTSSTAVSKPTQRPPAQKATPTHPSAPPATPAPAPSPQGTQGPDNSPAGTLPSPQRLNQFGWTNAGLTLGDALEALRTGTTFTDREMSYDYRNIGTPAHHSGTLTGSTFLLTPGGQFRFVHNDVRMINNTLYNKIQAGKIIQQVVNAQPTLVHFQVVQVLGKQHTFAWISVTFELLQSKIDPASGKRIEQLQTDPATGQPLIHHMAVILVRILPQRQGSNAPMGGTGWLVDTYELDTNTLPAIAIDPSI
ncbi:hypothetical protein [Dictyobacter aurantiacus]|nr:hypothetical protein [Dictyobacter aurantiacus]